MKFLMKFLSRFFIFYKKNSAKRNLYKNTSIELFFSVSLDMCL